MTTTEKSTATSTGQSDETQFIFRLLENYDILELDLERQKEDSETTQYLESESFIVKQLKLISNVLRSLF